MLVVRVQAGTQATNLDSGRPCAFLSLRPSGQVSLCFFGPNPKTFCTPARKKKVQTREMVRPFGRVIAHEHPCEV